MKSLLTIALFAAVSIFNYRCDDNPASYDANKTGFTGQVRAINTGGPAIDGGTEYKGICTITLLDPSQQSLSEFESDSLGNFKMLVAPGTYHLQVLHPKLSDASGPFIVTKNNFKQVIAVYDMKLK